MFILLSLCFSAKTANIAILSWHGYISEEEFFKDPVNTAFPKLKELIRKEGHTCTIAKSIDEFESADHIILFNIQLPLLRQIMARYPHKNRLLFLWEPPVIDLNNYEKKYHRYFSRIFTWDDDLIKKNPEQYYKFYYIIDDLAANTSSLPFENRKFCTLIAADKSSGHPKEIYSERKKTITFFEKYHPAHFEFYGRLWPHSVYRTYRGEIENKLGCLKNYKFCICYENMRDVKGYITEKIFDCFKAGCIPIYWGAENITDVIPKNCFIDRRDFTTHADLYAFLKSLTQKQLMRYSTNMQRYCKSKRAAPFSVVYFAQTLLYACGLKD